MAIAHDFRSLEARHARSRADARLAADLLDTAMVITHADAGHVQLRDGAARVRTVAQDGLPRSFGAVVDGDPSAKAMWRRVFDLRQRIVVADLFEARGGSSTSEDALRAVGLHATQTSPIIASGGDVVGVLSTHTRKARMFSEDELMRLDLLLQRAADLLHHPADGDIEGDAASDARRVDEALPPRHIQLDLRLAVGLAVDAITPQIRAHGHELTVCLGADPVWIAGDQRGLITVFASLLRNAVTHTPPAGKLSVFVHVSSGWAAVHVSDNGRGIPKGSLEHVFDRRTPADGGRRLTGDISLAEVRCVVEQHRGEIAAHSDGVGHGSRFVVRLPALMSYRSNRRA